MFETILVGTDGSEGALEALQAGGTIAKAMGVKSVHVVAACPAYSSADVKRIEEQLPKEFHDLVSPHMRAEDRFFEAAGVLRPLGIESINHETPDGAAAGILDVAKEINADLIVVGARGLNAVERFFRGSVSTRVAHHAPCSVLIIENDA